MVFGDRRQLVQLDEVPKVSFMGEVVMSTESVRNLGVIMDANLSWERHVQHVVNKCFGILIGISHVKHTLPASVLPRIVDSLVLSHIRYCAQVYGSCGKNVLTELQKNSQLRSTSYFRSTEIRPCFGCHFRLRLAHCSKAS